MNEIVTFQDETLAQRFILKQYALIQEHANRSEKRASAIFKIILDNPECFYYVHSIIDFKLISMQFMREISSVVDEFIFYKTEYNIKLPHLLKEYRYGVLLLVQFRKEIMNDIILNALHGLELEEKDLVKQELEQTSISVDRILKEIGEKLIE